MFNSKFRTAEVTQLYEDVREWCHPEYPLLDPLYSSGSNMPVVDFTPYVAAWLRTGRYEAINELWSMLTCQSDASAYMLKQVLAARLPSWIMLSETAKYELHAIYILSMRAHMCGGQGAVFVGSLLATTTVASRQLEIAPAYHEELLRVIQSEITKESFLGAQFGRAKGAKCSLEKAMSPLAAAETAAEKLKVVPPMVRAVVYDYLVRNWGQGTLRFNLYYDDRLYGCGVKWNQHYTEWLDFFCPPTQITQVPQAVTKDILREALLQEGISFKKTASKQAMVEQANGIAGFLPALVARVCPEKQELRPEWVEPVKVWAERVKYCEPIGAALLKLLALSAMKFK
ncbi:MAG: hypothetical protein WCO56_19295 [Verrucomicrobiota bacterium]